MVSSVGCDVVMQKRIRDDFEGIKSALKKAVETCDVVLISGGSSVGTHDMTPRNNKHSRRPWCIGSWYSYKTRKTYNSR